MKERKGVEDGLLAADEDACIVEEGPVTLLVGYLTR